jgi:hypothetical protein
MSTLPYQVPNYPKINSAKVVLGMLAAIIGAGDAPSPATRRLLTV